MRELQLRRVDQRGKQDWRIACIALDNGNIISACVSTFFGYGLIYPGLVDSFLKYVFI